MIASLFLLFEFCLEDGGAGFSEESQIIWSDLLCLKKTTSLTFLLFPSNILGIFELLMENECYQKPVDLTTVYAQANLGLTFIFPDNFWSPLVFDPKWT